MSAMRRGPDAGAVALAAASLRGTSATPPVRRIILQGDADTTTHPANAAAILTVALGPDLLALRVRKSKVRGRGYARSDFAGPDGAVLVELWMIEGAGHAWSGGRAKGSFTDPKGPDASAQMVRFFRSGTGRRQ